MPTEKAKMRFYCTAKGRHAKKDIPNAVVWCPACGRARCEKHLDQPFEGECCKPTGAK